MKFVLGLAVSAVVMYTAASSALCPDSAKTAGKSGCGEKATQTVSGKEGGCTKDATTVAGKEEGGCTKSATAVAGKEGCTKDATTVAGKEGCCAKGATAQLTAGGEGCTKAATTVAGKAACTEKVAGILETAPKMTYKVGDFTTCCAKTAEAKALETNAAITYVVGEETFTDKMEATAKLTAAIEKATEQMLHVQFAAGSECFQCPMTAAQVAQKNGTKVMYRVAGFDFESKDKALEAANVAKAAAETVKVAYKVNGETYTCDKTASAKAAEAGAKITYVVGNEESCCNVMAGLAAAQAKLRVVVETVGLTHAS